MNNKILLSEEKLKNIRKLFGDDQIIDLTINLDFLIKKNWEEKDLNYKVKEFFSNKNIKIYGDINNNIKNDEISFEELDKNNDYIKIKCKVKMKIKDLFENINQINDNLEEVKISTIFGDYKI